MTRWIRWKYVAPRLIVLAIVCAAAWFCLPRVVRWGLIHQGERATGAKVDIAEVKTSLLDARIVVHGLQVADPSDPSTNLLQFDELDLDLDSGALLRKRLVVETGTLHGVRLGVERATSGALTPEPDVPATESTTDHAAVAAQWLQRIGTSLQHDLVKELETPPLLADLQQRWPAELERQLTRAAELRKQVETLRTHIEQIGYNPVRGLDILRDGANKANQFSAEFEQLRMDLERLSQQMEQDREAIAIAKAHDEAKLRQTLDLEHIDAQQLSEFLIGDELSVYVTQALQWIQWGRGQLPGSAAPQPERSVGFDFHFPIGQRGPSCLVRLLHLDGFARIAGREIPFEGQATGFSTEPRHHPEPAVVRLQTSGTTPIHVLAVFDHRGDITRDSLSARCPSIEQPERLLGDPSQLAVRVNPGPASIVCELNLIGDALEGQITFNQQHVQLQPSVQIGWGGERLANNLQAGMQGIERIDATVTLSGTLEDPETHVHSNLGNSLAMAFHRVVDEELVAQREGLLAELDAQIQTHIGRVRAELNSHRDQVLSSMNLSQDQVTAIQQAMSQQLNPGKVLGRGLPPVETFFR